MIFLRAKVHMIVYNFCATSGVRWKYKSGLNIALTPEIASFEAELPVCPTSDRQGECFKVSKQNIFFLAFIFVVMFGDADITHF